MFVSGVTPLLIDTLPQVRKRTTNLEYNIDHIGFTLGEMFYERFDYSIIV